MSSRAAGDFVSAELVECEIVNPNPSAHRAGRVHRPGAESDHAQPESRPGSATPRGRRPRGADDALDHSFAGRRNWSLRDQLCVSRRDQARPSAQRHRRRTELERRRQQAGCRDRSQPEHPFPAEPVSVRQCGRDADGLEPDRRNDGPNPRSRVGSLDLQLASRWIPEDDTIDGFRPASLQWGDCGRGRFPSRLPRTASTWISMT